MQSEWDEKYQVGLCRQLPEHNRVRKRLGEWCSTFPSWPAGEGGSEIKEGWHGFRFSSLEFGCPVLCWFSLLCRGPLRGGFQLGKEMKERCPIGGRWWGLSQVTLWDAQIRITEHSAGRWWELGTPQWLAFKVLHNPSEHPAHVTPK